MLANPVLMYDETFGDTDYIFAAVRQLDICSKRTQADPTGQECHRDRGSSSKKVRSVSRSL